MTLAYLPSIHPEVTFGIARAWEADTHPGLRMGKVTHERFAVEADEEVLAGDAFPYFPLRLALLDSL
jgi:hypothetical protein